MPRGSKSVEKRAELLDQAAALLMEHGYHGTGIKDVLDRVKVPKGSFYNYFDSKEGFVGEVIHHCAERTLAALDADLADGHTEALELLGRSLLRQMRCLAAAGYKEGCIFGNLAAEVAETSEVCREAAGEAMRAMRVRFQAVLERGQAEGTVRTDLEAVTMADFLLNAWEGALLRMKVERSEAPLRDCVELILGRFFRPEGREAAIQADESGAGASAGPGRPVTGSE